jgi:hypothetical protein
MKKTTIKSNRHRPLSLIPAFMRNVRLDRRESQIIGYELLFDESCEYLLNGNRDQWDWNKLYGWSLGFNHHKNSVRLVWRYNPIERVVEVAPYCYINGKRVLPDKSHIEQIRIGEKIKTSIEILCDTARVTIESDITCRYDFEFSDCEKKPLLGCWFYFGGNRKAPHDITIRYNETDDNICSLLRF